MGHPHRTSHPATQAAPPRLPFGGELANPTMAVYASLIRARTNLQVVGVHLTASEFVRAAAPAELSRYRDLLLQHLQRSDVHRLLGFVDSLRPRYQLTALELEDPRSPITVTIHRDGRLLVSPVAEYDAVHEVLTECLASSTSCLLAKAQ